MKFSKNDGIALAIALILPQLAGGLGAVATASSVNTWYKGLNKPRWNPPGWIFGPVWTTLYLLMGLASWLVWHRPDNTVPQDNPVRLPTDRETKNALAFYGLQLGLNSLWSVIFFGARNLGAALLELGVLWGMIAGTTASFLKLRRTAGLLMLPYLAWTTFAGVLNATLWRLNR